MLIFYSISRLALLNQVECMRQIHSLVLELGILDDGIVDP